MNQSFSRVLSKNNLSIMMFIIVKNKMEKNKKVLNFILHHKQF